MKPEQYWINRGEDVIGLDALNFDTRQGQTYEAITSLVTRYQPRAVLDIGCNIGALFKFLYASSYMPTYYGLDANPYALATARLMTSVLQGNLRALPFPSRAFDVVVVKDVIEHLEGLSPLREAFRVTRNALVLACYIPFSHTHQTIEQHQDGYYINTYNWGEVKRFSRHCGFTLVNTVRTHEANGTPNEITVWERMK